MNLFQPIVTPLDSGLTPRLALRQLSGLPHCLLMESSLRRPELGRYSFLTADPVMIVDLPRNTIDPLNRVQQILSDWGTPRIEGLPPFQGGWAGLLSYELGHSFEQLPDLPAGPIQLPALYLGLYDFVIAWDHVLDSVWLISQGLSTTEPERRMERAEMRTREILQRLPSCGEKHSLRPPINASETLPLPLPNKNSTKAWKRELPGKDWKVPDGFKQVKANICSNFTEQEYLERVRTAVEYINAGDIFQTNLAQQLLLPATRSSLDLYENLAQLNASTFSGYFDLGVAQIISCSPERLVSIRDRELETRPIKGTRRRTKTPWVDIEVQRELANDEKERSENTMIVDLMRNDFSKICVDDSVLVSQWCAIESYESVYHLVSAVRGRLREEVNVTEVIAALFPGGSVTGAPKIRAMEIIAELEGLPRGAYCGSLGYFGLSGDCDFNILIRTVTAQEGWWQIPVGGAIVSQSQPEREYLETWTKAAAILNACLRSGPTERASTSLPTGSCLLGSVGESL